MSVFPTITNLAGPHRSEPLALHERIRLLHNNPQSMRYLSHVLSNLTNTVPTKPLCALGLWANL